MKSRALLILAVLCFAAAIVPTLYAEESDSATQYTIQGYIVTPLSEGNSPLEGVSVSILCNGELKTEVTDETGFFSILVNGNTNLQIRFSLSGYTLRSCPGVTPQEGSTYMILTLTDEMSIGKNSYMITSDPSGLQCAMMMASTSTVIGSVIYNGGVVVGATVTFKYADASNSFYKETTTNSRGMFTLECPTGEFFVSVACSGFEKSNTIAITVSENTDPIYFSLTKSNQITFLGMDMIHFLMVIGVIFGMMVSAMMVVLSRRKDHTFDIIDDTISNEKEEEK